MTPAFDLGDALLVSAAFVLGGLVKGVAGFGPPTLGLGLVVLRMPMHTILFGGEALLVLRLLRRPDIRGSALPDGAGRQPVQQSSHRGGSFRSGRR